MLKQSHSHPCINAPLGCANQVECDGEWVRNHDGIPDVICDVFHRENGETDPLPCAECDELLKVGHAAAR